MAPDRSDWRILQPSRPRLVDLQDDEVCVGGPLAHDVARIFSWACECFVLGYLGWICGVGGF